MISRIYLKFISRLSRIIRMNIDFLSTLLIAVVSYVKASKTSVAFCLFNDKNLCGDIELLDRVPDKLNSFTVLRFLWKFCEFNFQLDKLPNWNGKGRGMKDRRLLTQLIHIYLYVIEIVADSNICFSLKLIFRIYCVFYSEIILMLS